jgi:hypothetical protein
VEQPNDPIERAARAIARASGNETAWRTHVATVRIVVEALDEPSCTMIDAGNHAMRGAWIARGQLAPAVAGDAAVAAAWEAMIDRLLGHA